LASETLRYDVVTGADTRGFKETAREAGAASRAARELSDKLATQSKTAQVAAGAAIALAKSDKILRDAELELSGAAEEARAAMGAQGKAAEESAVKTRLAGEAARGAGGGFGALATPMGAAIGAGVALAPVAVTLAAGLGGLGLAALSASKDTKAMNAELAPLRSELARFDASLKPEVLTLFGDGAGIASHVLKDLQPVAASTGKALHGVLGQVDAEFASKTWQDFFGFMERTAGPDVQHLGTLFVDLSNDIPGVLETLQPVADGLIKVTDAVVNLPGALDKVKQKTGANQPGFFGGTGLDRIRQFISWGEKHVPAGNKSLSDLVGLTGRASAGVAGVGAAAALSSPKVMTLAQQVGHLGDAYNAALTPLLAYSGAQVSQANDAVSLQKALKASHDQIGLGTAAQRASFSAANTYIQDLLTTAAAAQKSGQGVDAQIGAIRSALPALEHVKGGTAAYWAEVRNLVGWLNRLNAEKKITQTVTLYGNGTWAVPTQRSPSSGPGGGHQLASGGLVSGGVAGRDSVAAMLTPGELVIPTRMVAAGAVDHLRGALPGFASGGIVPSYGGPVRGLQPWGAANQAATVTAITSGLASAMAAAFKSAAAAPGFGPGSTALGGDAAANKALARSMFPWPASQWPSFDYLEMREAGYNRFARNPSSGAYGIPQALPESKLPFAGQSGGGSHAGPQLSWMFGYIHDRYGTPFNAALHERFMSWYDNGGILKPGLTLAYNGTGRPEQVIPPGRGGGGGDVHVHVSVNAPVGSKAELENWFVGVMNSAARGGKLAYALRHSPSAA